jgi:hypothetical protein
LFGSSESGRKDSYRVSLPLFGLIENERRERSIFVK